MRIVKFVTYHIRKPHKEYIPIAVDCNGLSMEEINHILNDACSLHGVCHVHINSCGKLRKDTVIISKEKHYEYDWSTIDKMYFNKMFNPKNFFYVGNN